MTVILTIFLGLTAFYGMLTAWMGIRVLLGAGRSRKKANPAETASFTVLIPCRNEAENLPRLLTALSNADAQIVVIDDHSTDNTAQIALDHGATLIQNEGEGKKAALRSGYQAATGNHLITLDADVLLPENWFEHLREALREAPADLWLFPVLINQPSNALQRFEAWDVISLAGTTAAFAHQHHAIMGSGACLVVTAEAYGEAIGNLREDYVSGDDVFLVQYLRKTKREIRFMDAPELQVRVEGASSLRSFLRQRVRWGYKTPAYTDRVAQLLAFMVLSMNFIAVVGVILFLVTGDWWWLLPPAGKAAFDLLLLYPSAKVFKQKRLLRSLPMALVLYPLYLTLTGSAAVFTHPDVVNRQWR